MTVWRGLVTRREARKPHHTGTHGQGPGSHVPFWNDHHQFADGTVPALQIPAPERAGTAGHPLL